MRPDSAEWHKARIQLEGNPVFQALRLELDTLREERAELIEALRGLLLRYDSPYGSSPTAEDFKHTRALLSRLGADK